MDTVDSIKKSSIWRLVSVTSLLLISGLCGMGRAAVSDHLFWGQILQSRVYDDPAYETPLYVFELELETDASVHSIEFLTPSGHWDLIPSDASTVSDETETYHWTYESTHVWEYWGYYVDAEAIDDIFGDGEYTVILHHTDGGEEETTVWYGVPGRDQAVEPPTQKPNIAQPSYDGVTASPVVFEWDPVTDVNVWDIFLRVRDANDQYVVSGVYDANAVGTAPYSLSEGTYNAELSFENYYAVTNPDGVPFDLLKTMTLWRPFEVVYGTVYRFWSPIANQHFYTMDEAEKNKLIEEYSDVWTFEGPAFHAWATRYFPDLAPVYRFWSERSGSHLYTIDEAEKNALLARPHSWTYEGVAFYAYPEGRQPDDTMPVYRFWSPSENSHFYTIDPYEAEKFLTQYDDIFIFEGTAFYAYE
jgi:hypothetical protein